MNKKEKELISKVHSKLRWVATALEVAHEEGNIDLDAPTESFPSGLRFAYTNCLTALGDVEKIIRSSR